MRQHDFWVNSDTDSAGNSAKDWHNRKNIKNNLLMSKLITIALELVNRETTKY
jgi:hypothetical protein